MIKQLPVVPLFEQFIKDTQNGRRRKLNGDRILYRTVVSYQYVLKLLIEFEHHTGKTLQLSTGIRNNLRLLLKERAYWKSFYLKFTDFLLFKKGYFDNYTGSMFKVLKSFFRYLKAEKALPIQETCERFYIRREDIRVIALLPQQFCLLIADKNFELTLSPGQRRCKDLFVFGCTAAMRFSDLQLLKVQNIEHRCGDYYLVFHSLKTDTPAQVKLPPFAVVLFGKYARNKQPQDKLFPGMAAANFDKHLKAIGEKAGWTEVVTKLRTKNGRREEIKHVTGKGYRFCDYLSTHLMRKTGITVLLMLGMQEYLVRKISGHAAHSKEFFRYVNFAQSYITDELDKAYQKLLSLYTK